MATQKEISAAAAKKREAKLEAKRAAERALLDARRAAQEAAFKLPPEYQQWGSIRTRVWLLTAQECRRVAELLRVSPERLTAQVDAVKRVSTMADEECAEVLAGFKVRG